MNHHERGFCGTQPRGIAEGVRGGPCATMVGREEP